MPRTPLVKALQKSVRRKVLVPVLAAGVALVVAGILCAAWAVDAQLRNRLEEQAGTIVSALASVSGHPQSAADLQNMVVRMASEPGVSAIVVAGGEEPRVIASSEAAWLGLRLEDLPDRGVADGLKAALSTGARAQASSAAGRDSTCFSGLRLELAGPDGLRPVSAGVLVQLRTDEIRAQEVWSIFVMTAGAFAGLSAVFLLAYGLFSRHVLKPLSLLGRQLGEWAPEVEIDAGKSAGDQIGALAQALKDSLLARKEQQSELRESELRVRQLTEGMKDVVWVLDPGTRRFRYISPSCQKLFGYTAGELMAAPVEDTVIPRGETLEKVQRLIVEGTTAFLAGNIGPEDYLTTEILNSCKDGSLKWVDISYNFQRNPETGQIEVLGASRDTTERRKSEDALRASEEKFRGLFEANRDGVVLANNAAHFVDANPAAVAIYGCRSKQELFDQSPGALSPPVQPCGRPSPAMAMENHRRALGGETLTFDWVVRRIDTGADVFCEVTLTPVEIGGEHSVLATLHDLTEKRRAEADLRLSEQRHRLLAEHARDVIWTMELDGRVSYVSPSVQEVRGFTPEECKRHTLEETLVPESRPAVIAYMQGLREAIAAGRQPETFRGEQGYWRKDGSVFWSEVIAFPLLRADGSLVQLLGLSRDISAQKAMQKAVEEARDAADSANRSKSEFLANMSHEIRTPMNAVIGLSNLLREALSDGTQREYAEQIHQAGTSLLGVLDDILDYSRIEAGQMQIELVPLRISQVLDNCNVLFAAHPGTGRVALTFEVSPGVPDVLVGDPLRLLQVIKNLVANAMKFTHEGSVAVRVETLEESGADLVIKVTVQDTGIGMRPELQGKIFQAFNQGDISTTRKYGGAGLGLSICSRLVGLMGGEIGVVSTPGAGSTFWFTARLGKPAQGQDAGPRATGTPESFDDLAPLVAPIRGARVLVVDDTATNLLVARQYLRKLGFEVETASNGIEAVEKAKGGSFDAILMDLQMPEMDGLAATSLIREEEARRGVGGREVPIIALSAAAMVVDVQACLAAGMNDHIAKPVEPAALARTLVRWIPPGAGRPG